jgi:hypothetical protein
VSFQWIIDRAQTISIDTKQMVASTQTRDGTYRSVSRGGQPWKFDVQLPDGIPWTELRQNISLAQKLDRTSVATIQLNDPRLAWFNEYQGNSVNTTGFRATCIQGSNQLTLTQSPTTSNGYKFRAGDFIQLGNGHVYTVAGDVLYNSNTVFLHRPVIDAGQEGVILKVGTNCVWSIMCTQFPDWTLMAYNQVSWNGSFKFIESLV